MHTKIFLSLALFAALGVALPVARAAETTDQTVVVTGDDIGSAYGAPLDGATWQTDWFFNIGIWPNTTFYCFPFADICGTFIMIPLAPEKSLLRFGYYGPNRPMPEVTKACIKWMNEELSPEDIQLNVTQQRGLRSFGYNQGRYLIDPERSNESEHLVHHFHTLVHQAVHPRS